MNTRKKNIVFHPKPENVNLDEYCPISWNLLKDCKRIHRLDCGHTFDRGLLIQSIELSTLCPVCKKDIDNFEEILRMSDGEEDEEEDTSFHDESYEDDEEEEFIDDDLDSEDSLLLHYKKK